MKPSFHTKQFKVIRYPPFSNCSTRLDSTSIKFFNWSSDSPSFIALSASKESRMAFESILHSPQKRAPFDSTMPSRRSKLHEPKTYGFTQSMSKEKVFLYISVALVVDLKDFPMGFLQPLHTTSKYVEPSADPPNSNCVLSRTVTLMASTHERWKWMCHYQRR